jgi:putative SOS response-associated peptidase YedK
MTTLPNALTKTINHERSLVILTEEEFATWLRGSPEEAFGLIKTSDPHRMQAADVIPYRPRTAKPADPNRARNGARATGCAPFSPHQVR